MFWVVLAKIAKFSTRQNWAKGIISYTYKIVELFYFILTIAIGTDFHKVLEAKMFCVDLLLKGSMKYANIFNFYCLDGFNIA